MGKLFELPLWMRLALAAALVAAMAGAVAWFVHLQREIGRDEVRAEWARERELQLADQNEGLRRSAAETTRRLTKQQENQHAQNQELSAARTAAADADLMAVGLRDAHERALAARSAACHPAAVGDSPPAGPSDAVLALVQRRLDEAAGEFARHADASRIAGLKCERDYDALMPGH